MGIVCDYFMAQDEHAAADALRRDATSGSEADRAARMPTMTVPGMEPSIALARLEELMTGRSREEISADPTGSVLVVSEDASSSVVAITETLQQALVDARDVGLRRVAVPWSEPSDTWGCQGADAAAASELLVSFATFVRRGRASGLRLFCRVTVVDDDHPSARPGHAASASDSFV